MATGPSDVIRAEREREVMRWRLKRCAWDQEAADRFNELSDLIERSRQPATVISLLDWKASHR